MVCCCGQTYIDLLERQPVLCYCVAHRMDKGQDTYIQIARALASNGYIAVVQDIRGRGISDGEYFWQFQNNAETFDAQDGYDTVEWVAGILGSDGQVGTWGHSYPSWCIWRLAGAQPPSLKALFASGMSARPARPKLRYI